MTVVWCSLSAHGLGHAAQVIPILNELGTVVDNLHVILRTCVPPSFFQQYLQVSWDLQAIPQDIGCIQRGPLEIDIDGTWAAYHDFHENWSRRVSEEAQAMREAKVNLVISNISYLAIASALPSASPRGSHCIVVLGSSIGAIYATHRESIIGPSMSIFNRNMPRPIVSFGFIRGLTCRLSDRSLIRVRLFLWQGNHCKMCGSFWE